MNTEREALKIVEELKKVVQSSVTMVYFAGDSEEHILDAIEKAWRAKLLSMDSDMLSSAILVCLEMSVAWNDAVEALGDNSLFHRDALTKRLIKVLWEE